MCLMQLMDLDDWGNVSFYYKVKLQWWLNIEYVWSQNTLMWLISVVICCQRSCFRIPFHHLQALNVCSSWLRTRCTSGRGFEKWVSSSTATMTPPSSQWCSTCPPRLGEGSTVASSYHHVHVEKPCNNHLIVVGLSLIKSFNFSFIVRLFNNINIKAKKKRSCGQRLTALSHQQVCRPISEQVLWSFACLTHLSMC